ncbi:hypothetical protein CJF31_00009722 [Rutstroemia sp. NJR-2017a BVV2]|nr:hypothetical protein CJF31_00009722 [Rutstroemia sp. NJR-2017a BVV2]
MAMTMNGSKPVALCGLLREYYDVYADFYFNNDIYQKGAQRSLNRQTRSARPWQRSIENFGLKTTVNRNIKRNFPANLCLHCRFSASPFSVHKYTQRSKMVHHGNFPGLEVTVKIGGSSAVEYEDDEEIEVAPGPAGVHQAARTVSKYVEAVTGAEFSIKVSLSRIFKWDSPVLEVGLTVDGTWISGVLIFPKPDAEVCRELEGVHQPPAVGSHSREWTLKKLQFAQLEIKASGEMELETLKRDKNKAEKVGLIEVKVFRSAINTYNNSPSKPVNIDSSSMKFHEKALKGQAKSHAIGLSATTSSVAQTYCQTTKLDGVHFPLAIFRFKYRSKESLKQLLIMERTPEPEDTPIPEPAGEVDLNNLTAVQKERLQEFLRNEGIAGVQTPDRKVKREKDDTGIGMYRKRPRTNAPPVVIDLLSDSEADESTPQDRELLEAKAMAILDLLPDIEITVDVDKQPLKEYNDDDLQVVPGEVGEYQASRTVSKYIEAVSGKDYCINMKVGSGYQRDCPTLSFELDIDGKRIRSWCLRECQKLPWSNRVRGVKTMVDSNVCLKCFQFSELETCESTVLIECLIEAHEDLELSSIEETEKFEKMSEIIVRIYRKTAAIKSSVAGLKTFDFSELGAVHEKALKGQAISHGTNPVKNVSRDRYNSKFIDGRDYPIAIYRFKYRSKDALKSLLIIDHTPEPELPVSPSPRQEINTPSFNIDNLNSTQKAELGKFLASLIGNGSAAEGNQQIKREREDNGSPVTDNQTIKREREEYTINPSGSRIGASKRRKQSERIEVDLTADDSN